MGDSWDPFPLIYQLLGVKSILLSVTISYYQLLSVTISYYQLLSVSRFFVGIENW